MAVFATLSFVASLFQPGTLIEIGSTAFGGFAQLSLPVIVALYWPGTTRRGMLAGVGLSQAAYLLSVFTAVPDTIWGWDFTLFGMAIGLVLTVGVSWATAASPGEDRAVYFDRLGAD